MYAALGLAIPPRSVNKVECAPGWRWSLPREPPVSSATRALSWERGRAGQRNKAITVYAQFARPSRAAVVAVLATAYYAVAAVATHFVSPQYDLVRDYISNYAVGPYGWIYGSAFLASSVGCIALAAALWHSVPHEALSKTGIVLLVAVGATYALVFFFPTDILAPGEPPRTPAGLIHALAAFLGWVLFVACAFLITSKLKRSPYWTAWRGPLLVLSWLALLSLIALILVVAVKRPVGGLVERAFILDRNVWALIAAIAAYGASAREPARTAPRADADAGREEAA